MFSLPNEESASIEAATFNASSCPCILNLRIVKSFRNKVTIPDTPTTFLSVCSTAVYNI